MYYHAILWKDIKDNNASKDDVQTIMGFVAKTGFGVTSLKLQAEPAQPQYYADEPQYADEQQQGADPQQNIRGIANM